MALFRIILCEVRRKQLCEPPIIQQNLTTEVLPLFQLNLWICSLINCHRFPFYSIQTGGLVSKLQTDITCDDDDIFFTIGP